MREHLYNELLSVLPYMLCRSRHMWRSPQLNLHSRITISTRLVMILKKVHTTVRVVINSLPGKLKYINVNFQQSSRRARRCPPVENHHCCQTSPVGPQPRQPRWGRSPRGRLPPPRDASSPPRGASRLPWQAPSPPLWEAHLSRAHRKKAKAQ